MKVTGAIAESMAMVYRQGYSIRQVAEAFGVSYGTVHRYLSILRVPMRPRGGARHSKAEQR